MKLPSLPTLLSCLALSLPLAAQAAMDTATRTSFTEQCLSAAKGKQLSDEAAKAHCDCGARQVDSFSEKEIEHMNDPKAAQDPKLTAKLQSLVAQNCAPQKK